MSAPDVEARLRERLATRDDGGSGLVVVIRTDLAALLATVERYEKALWEIAKLGHDMNWTGPIPTPKNVCHMEPSECPACIAEAALALPDTTEAGT